MSWEFCRFLLGKRDYQSREFYIFLRPNYLRHWHNDLMLAIELATLALLGVVLVDAHNAGGIQLGPRAAPATGR